MNHINVTINGRQYRMACEDGQEVRLFKLAESMESRVTELRGKFGEIRRCRLTVMAALTVCDELLDATARIRVLEEELEAQRHQRVAVDRSRQGDPGCGDQHAERSRRPHGKDCAGPEPHHRRRGSDRGWLE